MNIWNPNFITKLATTAFIGVTSIFTNVGEAQAQTCFDVSATNGIICNTYEGQTRDGYSLYRLGYATDTFKSGMDVVCDGRRMVRWQSNSNMSRSYNNTLATYFCGL